MPIAVADANLIVSAFTAAKARSPARLALGLLRARFTLCISAAIEAEYREVLLRPKFRRYGATPDLVATFVGGLAAAAILVTPGESVTDCRDPDDAIYLEAALAGGAGLIVSGDQDLLALHPWRGIPILAPGTFLAAQD